MDGNELQQKVAMILDGVMRHEVAPSNAAKEVVQICIDEALGEPTEDEMIATARVGVNWAFGKGLDYDRVRDIFANRKARLLAPKTAEERVTVERSSVVSGGWNVRLDDKIIQSFMLPRNAETFRRGLIAELKEQHS